MGGKLISFSPARGPLLSSRRSLQILDIFTAIRLSTLENMTKAPMSDVASRWAMSRVNDIDGKAGIFRFGRNTGADGRCPQVDLTEQLNYIVDPLNIFFNRYPEAVEFLPERHGNGILKMGPPTFDDIVEFLFLFQ